MKDIYNFIAKKEDSTGLLFNKWSLGQLATFIDEYVGELEAKNNESLHDVICSDIGCEYEDRGSHLWCEKHGTAHEKRHCN